MTARVARYRAVIAYDGTGYQGFQRQAGDTPTIQGTVEDAILRVTGQQTTVIGAGRTDSGVHASGQVITFDAVWRHKTTDLWRALNATVPKTIAIRTLEEAEAGFHPRFDAQSRAYQYTLYVAPVQNPLQRQYAWFVPDWRPLDLNKMQAAASLLMGIHDFATFGQPPQGDNTIRQILRSEFTVMPEAFCNERLFRYHIEANAFLYRMVRRIVGALVRVGSGKLSITEFEDAFRAADGTWPNETAPAHGLCLTKVNY